MALLTLAYEEMFLRRRVSIIADFEQELLEQGLVTAFVAEEAGFGIEASGEAG